MNETAPGLSTTAPPGDAVLLDRVHNGNQQAMTDLFDRYAGLVYSTAIRILGDGRLAEDVMQEIFIQLWQDARFRVKGQGSLGPWLMVVARNRAIDVLRRRKPVDSLEDVVLADPYNLAAEAERNIMMEKVRRGLDHLPAEQRSTLEMAFFEGLTHTEISQRTGSPLGTVKTRIRLALIGLRKAFRE